MAQPTKKESLGLTTDLARKLIKAFPQYKGLSEKDFLDMLDKISAAETQDKNIYQLKGGPGRGYYQMELSSAPVAYDRALNIQKELKERGIDLPKLPRYDKDFTKLSKDEQAFYTLAKMVGAAGAKRLQGEKDYYLNPKDPKKMWLELHWAGKAEDKPARIKHWEEIHGKEALVPEKIKTLKQEITKPTPQPAPEVKKVQTQVEQEIEQPDLHPAGPEKVTVSAAPTQPVLSNKKVKQLANAKFVPNPIGIPIFTEKGTFAWDKPPGELDIMLYGRPGPTIRRAQAIKNAEAVQPPTYARGGLIKRADGSYSKKGLWDNIRANKGSGRKPTKEMLAQEAKIRAAEKKEDGGPIYNWIPPNYPRVGARNAQGGWLDQYADGGDVPHDYMYSQGNVSSYLPGTSVHPAGITNVPDSPCGPGFTVQYDETGNPVCMPIATPAPSAPSAPTAPTVLAGATPEDYYYAARNSRIYSSQPLETYSEIRTRSPRIRRRNIQETVVAEPARTSEYMEPLPMRGINPLEVVMSGANIIEPLSRKQGRVKDKKIKTYKHRGEQGQGLGIGRFFKNLFGGCEGDDCYKFQEGGSVNDQKIPDTTAYEFGDKFMAYPDPTLTNYQNLSPKSKLPDGKIVDATPKIPAYAHGATVWNKRLADKQMSAAYVIGPDTDGTQVKNTYPDRMSGAENPTNYRIGDYIPVGMNYKSPAAGTYDYNKDVQPYYKMRLHAPDTRRMAYGGYVPRYKKGGFLSAIGDIGLGVVDSTLGSVGSVTGIKSMQDIIDEDQYANDKFDDVAGFAGKVAGTALKVIPVTAPFAAAAGAVGTVANKALKIDEKNYDPTQHTSAWDKWGSGIESVGSIASMAMGNVSGAAGAAGNISKAAEMANTISKGANLVNAGMNVAQGLGQGQVDAGSILNMASSLKGLQGGSGLSKTNNLGGLGDIGASSGMLMAKHGGRIPGLRWHQLNPGVSAPEGVYTSPTNQRGITFADGGDVDTLYVQDKNDPRLKAYRDSSAAYEISQKFGKIFRKNPYDPEMMKYAKEIAASTDRLGLKPYKFLRGYDESSVREIPAGGRRLEEFWEGDTPTMVLYKKPVQPVVYNPRPDMAKVPMRGMTSMPMEQLIPQKTSVGRTPELPATYRSWNTGEELEQIPAHLKIGSNWRTPQFKKKNGGWLDSYEDGGDVLEVKPMLAAGPSAAMSTDPRQPKLGAVGMGYAGGKYNPYIQGKAGIQGGSLEAGVSPYIRMDKNLILNPSLGGGVSTAGLYGKAGLTGMYNLPNNLNFDLYGSAKYMQDARGGSLPIELGLAWSDTNPLVRTGINYDLLRQTIGGSIDFPIGAERNLFKYKAKPKSKSRYEDGGEVDITKPYLNPATVQATLARAQQPVTNTLGRVISTPASREKERREKIIAKDESKYSVEDYKKGIQEPGAGNSVLDDPLAMAFFGGFKTGQPLAKALGQYGKNVAAEATMGLSDLTKAGIQSVKPVINTAKNLEDLKAAQQFAQQYGYSLPTNVERIAQSDMLTDKVIRGMMDRHNTFVRGVSTNWNEIEKRNPEILRHLEGKGFDLSTKEGTKAAAEYMATHIPISTGYGRASLNRDVFNQGLEGLYTSNSIPTAEGYTYGQGFITKAKRPTNYSSSNRQDWITQNNPQYYAHNLPGADNSFMINNKITHPASLNLGQSYVINDYSDISHFKRTVLADLDMQAFELKLKYDKFKNINPAYADNMKKASDDLYKQYQEIENQNWESIPKNFDKKLLKTEHVNVLSDSELGIGSPDMSIINFYDTVVPKLGLNVRENAQLRDELSEMAFNLRKQYGTSLPPKKILEEAQKLVKNKYTNRYAHYIHLGTPGEKILEPIKSWEITPEIWKNKSRGHTNKYTKKLSAMENGGIVSPNKYKQGGWLDNL